MANPILKVGELVSFDLFGTINPVVKRCFMGKSCREWNQNPQENAIFGGGSLDLWVFLTSNSSSEAIDFQQQ